MKIDLITLHRVQNYGSVLQAFATQEILKEHNCDVTVIDYVRENVKYKNLYKSWGGNNIIKRLVMMPTISRWKKVFDVFCRQYLNLSDKEYTTEQDFKSYPLTADGYCTGSDQVWNYVWNKGVIPPLYLSFVPEDKFKFAYAASFGRNELPAEEVAQTQEYISQYDFISVREESGKEILSKQYGYENAVHLVDPTLAMPPEFWRKYGGQRKIKYKYILIYNLNRSKDFDNYAKALSKKTGFKLVRFCTRYDQILRVGKSALIPNVFDFINLIDNAELVLTDSFHATAFSMNMNTEPICIYPKNFGGRLSDFLHLVGSEQRHATSYDDFDVLSRRVDFEKVNAILDNQRKKNNEFLDKVLAEINKSR